MNQIISILFIALLIAYVVLIPVNRDELLMSLIDGLGDIASANLTITPERQKRVDFSIPGVTGVKETLVTGQTASSRDTDGQYHPEEISA